MSPQSARFGGRRVRPVATPTHPYLGVINNLIDGGIAVVIATEVIVHQRGGQPGLPFHAIAVGIPPSSMGFASFSSTWVMGWLISTPCQLHPSRRPISATPTYKSGTSMAAPCGGETQALSTRQRTDAAEREVELVLYRLQSTGTAVANRESPGAAVGFSVPRINIEQASQATYLDGQLTSGVAVNNLFGNQGENFDYYIGVPAGVDELTIALDVGNSDPDIYVDARRPTNSRNTSSPPLTPTCSSVNSTGQDRSCAISNLPRDDVACAHLSTLGIWQHLDDGNCGTVPGTSIDSITPGDGTHEVAFSPKCGGSGRYRRRVSTKAPAGEPQTLARRQSHTTSMTSH